MESDGRIRSKDIGTGEVNSRALDNIRSSNYDGSHTDPETNPGTQGWQILKNGFVVINNAIIRGTLLAGKIISGTLNIGSGGSITVGDEADPLVTLDESGLTVGDAPVVIDATGLDVGGGLVTVDSSGVQVGTDVVIDSTGLQVDGGPVRSLDIESDANTTSGNTLTTTATQKAAVTFTKPSWAQSAIVLATARLQGTDSGFGPLGYISQVRIDDAAEGGSLASQHDTNGLTVSVPHVRYSVITPGSTVEVSCYGSRNGGSGNPTGVWATIHATIIWLR